jgi:uncharacterized membrane protein YhaH (DUF805 family)
VRLYWPALVLSAIPAACLLWGILTGKMPQRYGTFDRRSNGAGFWMMAMVWGGLSALLLWVGFRL